MQGQTVRIVLQAIRYIEEHLHEKTVRICFCFIAGISIFVFLFSLLGGENIAKVFAENNRNVFEICSHIFPADVWIYYSVPFGIAEIFRGNKRMACNPACRVFHAHADGISDRQASETVPLFLKGR